MWSLYYAQNIYLKGWLFMRQSAGRAGNSKLIGTCAGGRYHSYVRRLPAQSPQLLSGGQGEHRPV